MSLRYWLFLLVLLVLLASGEQPTSAQNVTPAHTPELTDMPTETPTPRPTPTPTQIPNRADLYEPAKVPEHMAYTWWDWHLNQTRFRTMTTDVTIHNSVDFSGQHGIYVILGQGHISDEGYYYGLQTDVYDPRVGRGTGKGLIFSRWGTRDIAHARVPDDGWVQSSGHEGDFVGVRRGYNWRAGEYRLILAPDGDDADGEWFALSITDLSTDETTWVGSLKFPYENGKVLIAPPSYTAIEVYGYSDIRPIGIPLFSITVKPPQGDDNIAANQAYLGYSRVHGQIQNSEARRDRKTEAIFLKAGGLTERESEGNRRVYFSGVTVAPTSLILMEGATSTYAVKLYTRPQEAVTVAVASKGNPDVTASPTTLAFNGVTWSTPQTVTVTAAHDADEQNDSATVTHTVNRYGSVTTADSVTVTVTDDDGNPTVQMSLPETSRVRLRTAVPVAVAFSQAVSGFGLEDVTATNGSAENLMATPDGAAYSFDVVPTAIGTVTVDIPAGAAQNAQGQDSVAAPQLLVGFPYDDDHDGAISKDETIIAIRDYLFGGGLTRDEVTQVIRFYLFGG